MVVAPLRAGRGGAAGPDTAIDGIDGLAVGQRVPAEQAAQGRVVHTPLGQRPVEAAPTAAMHRFQAQVGRGEHRTRRQQGISQIHQRSGPPLKAAIERVTEGVQGGDGCRLVHSRSFCHPQAHTATHRSLVLNRA